MRCKLIGFCDAHTLKMVESWQDCQQVCAVIVRLDRHPVLGYPSPDKITYTSEVRLVNFQAKYIITQNSVYDFAGA